MNKVSIADIYRQILKLYEDEAKFSQGYYTRDEDGKVCTVDKAVSFCALGALWHVAELNNCLSREAQCCLQRVSEHLYEGVYIQIVNDELNGLEKVRAALRFAIELWDGRDPTEAELSMSVEEILRNRKDV